MGTRPSGGGVPALVAAMILRWFGQMRIHTLANMMVPKMPPRWMNTARPDMIVPMQEGRPADIVDRIGVTETELNIVRPLFQSDGPAGPKVLWVRSTGSHIAFCERREAAPPSKLGRDVITIVKVVDGKVVGKWQFG